MWFGEYKTKEERMTLFQKFHKAENFIQARQHSEILALSKAEKYLNITNSEQCFSNYINNSKCVNYSSDVIDSEDCKYINYVAF